MDPREKRKPVEEAYDEEWLKEWDDDEFDEDSYPQYDEDDYNQ